MRDLTNKEKEAVVSSIQQTDPTGMAFQLDFEFIEPMLISAYDAVQLDREVNGFVSQDHGITLEIATIRVARAISTIFYGS